NAKSLGEGFAHLGEVRPELWLFGDDHGIDVLDGKVFFSEQFLGVLQEKQAVCAFPLGVSVGKMRADVAKPRRAEQSIAKGMGKHVTVGMSDRALVERQLNSADDEFSPFGQPMQVVADAAAGAHAFCVSQSR